MNEQQDSVRVLTDPDHLRVLKESQLITFETNVLGHISHHQISIMEFDTRDKIEKKMAETMVQIREELQASNNHKRNTQIPQDIQGLVEEHKLN